MPYCRRCDLLAGYGALGVFAKPDRDEEWLSSHCWCCGRDAADCEVIW